MAGRDLTNYVEVADRVKEFYEKYPEGSLQGEHKLVEVGGNLFVEYVAYAYRDREDPHPGRGTTWEPYPGRTNFTRDSEVENAETSAWGRALAGLGFVAKKDGTNGIASANEVRNRRADQDQPTPPMRQPGGPASEPQRKFINTLLKRAKITKKADANRVLSIFTGREITGGTAELTKQDAAGIIEKLQNGEVPSITHPSDVPGDGAEFTHPVPEGEPTPFDAVEAIKTGFNATEEPAA